MNDSKIDHKFEMLDRTVESKFERLNSKVERLENTINQFNLIVIIILFTIVVSLQLVLASAK
ncbi:hypothetical protein DVR12_23515 [Chitinophaga silvatica]|uniref:Haemolysin XhlA n=1 Tax=Chitinophaga silvatica TaxID=2282649 RepID=A0A3E1Y4J9_9BACT|nr:hypothetical protein DVR12_23515 [Chitinophaga silvatica]